MILHALHDYDYMIVKLLSERPRLWHGLKDDNFYNSESCLSSSASSSGVNFIVTFMMILSYYCDLSRLVRWLDKPDFLLECES